MTKSDKVLGETDVIYRVGQIEKACGLRQGSTTLACVPKVARMPLDFIILNKFFTYRNVLIVFLLCRALHNRGNLAMGVWIIYAAIA